VRAERLKRERVDKEKQVAVEEKAAAEVRNATICHAILYHFVLHLIRSTPLCVCIISFCTLYVVQRYVTLYVL
jgi:hypothetical protein